MCQPLFHPQNSIEFFVYLCHNKDVIKNGRNGILVPIQDPNAIADALQYLYEHREIRYEYAKNCLEDADQYKPDKVMAEFYQTMEEYWK